VVVPSGGTGTGILYVAPVTVTPPTQTLAGHIYDCTGGTATTTEVTGGTLSASGPTTVASTPNPLTATPVDAGTYTMSGTAPAGEQFVACGVETTTPNQTSVVVPSGGTGTGILYVAPAPSPLVQTVSGVIDLCSGDMAPTAGSLLTVESTGVTSINPLLPTQVAAGGQTVDAIAPSGYHFVGCHETTQQISTPTTATETVNVPAGGTTQAVFYVEKNETGGTPPLSLTVVKTNDADADGAFHDTETASAPAKDVTFQVQIVNNSSVALVIDSVVDAWSGSTANECANLLGTTLAAGATTTCTFTLAAYSPAAGGSLPDTVTVIGHQLDNPGNTTSGQDTSTVLTPPATPATPGAPDLSILKTASAAGVTVGDTLTYTLLVTNVGGGATTGTVTVTDAVPAGLALGAITSADWTCGAAGQAITCTYNGGAIAPGQTVGGITVATTVLTSAPTVVTNTGVVKTPGDTNPANDTSTVKTPVTQVLGVKIPRAPGTTPGTPGKPGTPSTPQVPTEIPTVAPTALPMTGTGVTALLPAATGMLAAGLLLVVAGRRRRRA
jgi:uncharacterized repeat protein (TIGR01451 family)